MTKLLQVNDIHSSDNPSRYRTPSYCDDIFEKLGHCVRIAGEQGCSAILLTGDLFHITAPTKNSHNLVSRWLKLLDTFPSWYIVVGNHDLTGGDLSRLDRQPIGILGQHSNATIFEEGKNYVVDGLKLAGVHWRYNMEVSSIENLLPTDKPDILAIHAPLSEYGNPFFDTIPFSDMMGYAKVVAYGHMHSPHPPIDMNGTWFVNPGSLSRRSLGKSQVDDPDQMRTPQVALIDMEQDKVDIKYIDIPCRPASEIYRFEQYEMQQDNERVTEFVKSLKESSVAQVTAEDIIDLVNSFTDDVNIRQTAEELLRL